jgi:hydrogenase/urease accessory protein HupE
MVSLDGRGVRRLDRVVVRVGLLAGLGVFLWPARAEAHLVTTGLGPVYDGISHLVLSPDDLLPVLAMGLLAGLNGAASSRLALFALPGAWLAGGIAGVAIGGASLPSAVTSISFLVVGGLTAADRRLTPVVVSGLAIGLGLVHGWQNGAGLAEAQREALGLLGITGAIFTLVALVAAFVVSLRLPWTRIVVRVAGSWIVAIGLLMLGWALRGSF